MPSPILRDATPDDAAAIAAIYNDAARNTTAIWNSTEVDAANRIDWMTARRAAGYPVLVAASEGAVLGYASFGPFRAFEGYRHTAELSIYVGTEARGGGIGSRLLGALIERAEAGDIHVLIAAIEAGNLPSIALHQRHGFKEAAVLHQVGTKFGRWLDLLFMERRITRQPRRNAGSRGEAIDWLEAALVDAEGSGRDPGIARHVFGGGEWVLALEELEHLARAEPDYQTKWGDTLLAVRVELGDPPPQL